MSYLDIPRIHFAGTFITDPSTVDNKRSNYSAAAGNTQPMWNPNGKHLFKLEGCTVRSAVDGKGKNAPGDAVVGGAVETTNDPRPARLVDLDTDRQDFSQVIGAELKISLKSGGGFLKGRLQRPTMRHLWFGRAPGGMEGAGGVFQTVFKIDTVSSDKLSSSPVMDALSSVPVSIKFVLYAYNATPGSAGFTNGKIVGSIGPFGRADGEDATVEKVGKIVIGSSLDMGVHFLHARRMADPGGAAVYVAPFKLNSGKKKLTIDLGNCIQEDPPGGAHKDIGALQAQIILPSPAKPVVLGTLDYTTAHYETTAGIEELTLTDAQVKQLKTNPLGLFSTKLTALIASERPQGLYVDVSDVTLRLNPGESSNVSVVATEFGLPKAGLALTLKQVPNAFANPTMAKPPSGIAFPASVTTNSDGLAGVTFTASDPGNPRVSVDGQVYCIGIFSGGAGPSQLEAMVTIKVFDAFAMPASPAWADVQPIFAEYAKLYPAMTGVLDLSNQSVVQTMAKAGQPDILTTSMSKDEDDPGYMPVSRDLSRDKKAVILKWLAAGAP